MYHFTLSEEEARNICGGFLFTEDDVYIVWSCKTLQNFKALASTTVSDGVYYEITHNGDKNETYVDVYKKWENFVVRGGKYEDNK